MLNNIELLALLDQLGTPLEGRKLVIKARIDAPVRKVQSRGGNVITHYISKKMRRRLVLESRSVEFQAAVRYENSKEVLEYFAQPVALDLNLTNTLSGRPYRQQHTPDFLVLTPDQIFLDEWREEPRLQGLMAKRPGRYIKDSSGWRFPALEDHLAEIGIRYRLRSADELPRQYISNLNFLSDYLDENHPVVDVSAGVSLRAIMLGAAVIPLIDLVTRASEPGSGFTTDDIYKSIAGGQLVFDLDRDSIADTERARVYRDPESLAFLRRIEDAPDGAHLDRLDTTIAVGALVNYDGLQYEIALLGKDKILLKGSKHTSEVTLDAVRHLQAEGRLTLHNPRCSEPIAPIQEGVLPGPEKMDRILKRMEWLQLAQVNPSQVPVSGRTLARYRSEIKKAGDRVLDQHLALGDRYARCGNRDRKIPDELIKIIERVIESKYNTPTCPNKHAAFLELQIECQKVPIKPCSERTFLKEIRRLSSTQKRQGKRIAYQQQPIVDYLRWKEPLQGVRPFEFVHVDHTPLEILAKSPEEKESLGGVWLSLAIDAATRVVLGFYVTFDYPSYRSTMMVIRDIVRRHGRMPEMLIVDNGPDFRSSHLKRLCEITGCHLRYRPGGEPRFGAVLERLFGTLHTQLIHRMSGNTQIYKQHRSMTKSIRPENFVEWTLPSLHGAIQDFCERIYGTENHPALGGPPLQYFTHRMNETGARKLRLVAFDRVFKIETCPAPKDRSTRIVDGIRGVKINNFWYWNDALHTPNLEGKQVSVRVDPWDPGVVFVLVGKVWLECISKFKALLSGQTEVELRYALDALRKKHGISKKDVTPERLAEWVRVLNPMNYDPRLGKQQSEAKYLYGPLGMTTVTQEMSTARQEGWEGRTLSLTNSTPVQTAISVPVPSRTNRPSRLSSPDRTRPICTSEESQHPVQARQEDEYDLL